MLKPTRREENIWRHRGFGLIAGCDEAGKGAWAGPLVAAAVILPERWKVRGVRDSKLLSPERRQELYVEITRHALCWAIGVVSSQDIDRMNVHQANLLALRLAVDRLYLQPEAILVDGYPIEHHRPVKHFIDGDAKVTCIAAASIIAKVTRDTIMRALDRDYPVYGFAMHKGYGTLGHQRQLRRHGPSVIHRFSYAPIQDVTYGPVRVGPNI